MTTHTCTQMSMSVLGTVTTASRCASTQLGATAVPATLVTHSIVMVELAEVKISLFLLLCAQLSMFIF